MQSAGGFSQYIVWDLFPLKKKNIVIACSPLVSEEAGSVIGLCLK